MSIFLKVIRCTVGEGGGGRAGARRLKHCPSHDLRSKAARSSTQVILEQERAD